MLFFSIYTEIDCVGSSGGFVTFSNCSDFINSSVNYIAFSSYSVRSTVDAIPYSDTENSDRCARITYLLYTC